MSNFAPKTAEKCFIYKALEETGSLLRQVCKIFPRGGSNAMRQRSSAPLVDGCECDRRLPILMGLGLTLAVVMAARCPSSAEAWQSGSSFSKADSRSVPGEGSSFLQASVAGDGSSFAKASATSDFELRPTSPSRPGTAFTMPADRDEFARLRALISHAESRSLGYDDDHGSGGSAQIPPPKRPPDMSIGEIFAWVQSFPGQEVPARSEGSSGHRLRHHIRVLSDHPDISHSEIRGGCPCLFPIPQGADRDAEAAGELDLRQPQIGARLADKSGALSALHALDGYRAIFGVSRISRQNDMLFLHLCCSFSRK